MTLLPDPHIHQEVGGIKDEGLLQQQVGAVQAGCEEPIPQQVEVVGTCTEGDGEGEGLLTLEGWSGPAVYRKTHTRARTRV